MSTSSNGLKRRPSPEDGGISPPPLKRGKPSNVNQKTVANFFTPASKKETLPEKLSWRVVDDSLIVGRYEPATAPAERSLADKTKIAAFDFDSTLITTSSGNVFGKDPNDWKWWDSTVPSKLRSLYKDGYSIAIFSNQSGISLAKGSKTALQDKKRLADFKTKVAAVLGQLDLPVSVYAATSKDRYRKPRTGMWDEFLKDAGLGDSSLLNLDGSLFVGDAGGRPASSTRRKDFSCSDRDFAANVGLDFRTPEEFFLNQDAQPFTREFDPTLYLDVGHGASADSAPPVFSNKGHKNNVEIVLFCGSPASGKSTFYWKHLEPLGYERVNQDILKTRDRCLKVAESSIKDKGVSIAVDNTNADGQTRKYWIDLAKKLNVPIRCVLFTASTSLAQHNDVVRALNDYSTNPEKRAMLPRMAFTGFQSRFREPTLEEGFREIIKVNFQFEGTEEQRAVWKKFWL